MRCKKADGIIPILHTILQFCRSGSAHDLRYGDLEDILSTRRLEFRNEGVHEVLVDNRLDTEEVNPVKPGNGWFLQCR